jgi:hypothetical protein
LYVFVAAGSQDVVAVDFVVVAEPLAVRTLAQNQQIVGYVVVVAMVAVLLRLDIEPGEHIVVVKRACCWKRRDYSESLRTGRLKRRRRKFEEEMTVDARTW